MQSTCVGRTALTLFCWMKICLVCRGLNIDALEGNCSDCACGDGDQNEEEDLMDQAIGSKIADYLIKPVNPSQVLLTLKKNIHQREIVQEVTQTGYRQEFSRIDMQLSENLSAGDWKELYKRLVHWELELQEADSAMNDMLRMQKEEANQAFAKFVKRNYEQWIANADERPLISPDVFKRCIFPRLSAGRKVFLLVLDNLRFDQWRAISQDLAEDFDIEEDLYYSILPTATQYARNALFAGLMPRQIKEMYPELWVDEEEDEGKNLNEEMLIRRQLERYRRKEDFSYHKINDSSQVDKVLNQISGTNLPLNVLVINFIDILSHARTESQWCANWRVMNRLTGVLLCRGSDIHPSRKSLRNWLRWIMTCSSLRIMAVSG